MVSVRTLDTKLTAQALLPTELRIPTRAELEYLFLADNQTERSFRGFFVIRHRIQAHCYPIYLINLPRFL
ncbi:MAG: hypothetical protein ACFFC7_16205 [Candidatus Hermodarchaeota archaeon]